MSTLDHHFFRTHSINLSSATEAYHKFREFFLWSITPNVLSGQISLAEYEACFHAFRTLRVILDGKPGDMKPAFRKARPDFQTAGFAALDTMIAAGWLPPAADRPDPKKLTSISRGI